MILQRKTTSEPYADSFGGSHPNACLAAFKTTIVHGKEILVHLGIFADENCIETHQPMATKTLRFSKDGMADYYEREKYNNDGTLKDGATPDALGLKPAAEVWNQISIGFGGVDATDDAVLPWIYEQRDTDGVRIGDNWEEKAA